MARGTLWEAEPVLAGAPGSPQPPTPPRRDRSSVVPHPRPAVLLCPRRRWLSLPSTSSLLTIMDTRACLSLPRLPCPLWASYRLSHLLHGATLPAAGEVGPEGATQCTGDCTGCALDTARCEVVRKRVVLLRLCLWVGAWSTHSWSSAVISHYDPRWPADPSP